MDSIYDRVLGVIAGALGVDRALLSPDTAIGDLPEWDSVGNLAVTAAIERELGIDVPIDDLFEMTSVASIVEEVKKLTHA